MILPIYIYGQPVLRKESVDIPKDYPNLDELISNMFETLTASEGINPHIEEFDDTETESMEEGCLSLPGIHEKVVRPTRIRVRYEDAERNEHDEWVDGYLARVMQHEFDHLDAHMFIDRISPLRRQLIKNKLKALTLGKYRCSYRTKAARR